MKVGKVSILRSGVRGRFWKWIGGKEETLRRCELKEFEHFFVRRWRFEKERAINAKKTF